MKRCWMLLLGILTSVSPAFAQFTTVTGTITDPNGIPYSGAVLNAVLVPSTGGGYTLSGQPYSGRIGPVTLDSTGTFAVNFGDVTLITPGSPQWQITIDSAAATIGLPLGTGPQTFTFTSTGTTISGSSPVSLSASLSALAPKLTNFANSGLTPNTPGIPQNNGPGTIYAINYGVKADAKQNCFASTVNATNTVTVQQPGDLVSSADLGSIVFVTNGGCNGNYGSRNGTVIEKGFICSVLSSTSFTVGITYPTCAAANATATCTATPSSTGVQCPVNWGLHDDLPAWNLFFAAVTNFFSTTSPTSCAEGVGPNGRSLISGAIVSRHSFCGANSANGSQSFWSWTVHGGGPGATVLVPLPSFDASGCPLSCFFVTPDNAVTGSSIHDIVVDGGGNGTVTNGTNKYAFDTTTTVSMWNLNVTEWGNSGANNFTAYNLVGAIGSWMDVHGLHATNGGFRCATIQGLAVARLDCLDPVGILGQGSVPNGMFSTSQSNINCQDTFAEGGCVQVPQGVTWHSKDDVLVDTAQPSSIVECGGVCVLDGTNIDCSGSANCHGISMNDTTDTHGGTAYLHNVNYIVSGGVPITDGTSGAQVFDQCGNIGLFTNSVWTNIALTNCATEPSIAGRCLAASGASPEACAQSSNGKVAVPATTTTYTVNTTAAVTGSEVYITPTQDNSGISGTPTCAVVASPFAQITTAISGVSFTFSLPSNAGISCFNWSIR